jgi:hypothetical protein
MTARTIKLDSDGDLDLSSSGRMSLLEGRAAIAQRLQVRLSMFRGEWFLDLMAGVAYRDEVLVKRPDETAVSAMFRAEIMRVNGVIGIRSFDLTFDYAARELSLSFVAITEEGDIEAESETDPVRPWGFVLLFPSIGRIY